METKDPSARMPQDPVNLTIVGGRPSQEESRRKDVPRGLEVLLKKASVDDEFRRLLLTRRSEAGKEIGLTLDPAEVRMLDTLPGAQLEAIIRRTRVPREDRRIFLGKAASVMLATLGAGVVGCPVGTRGIQPDRVKKHQSAQGAPPQESNAPDGNPTRRASDVNNAGTQEDKPQPASFEMRIDPPEGTVLKRRE